MILKPIGLMRSEAASSVLQTGFRAPTAAYGAAVTLGLGGSMYDWDNEVNVFGAGEASLTSGLFDNNIASRSLVVTAFDFSDIASAATIVGIEAAVTCRCPVGAANWAYACLVSNYVGITQFTIASQLGTGLPKAFPATSQTLTFGGSTDLWGGGASTVGFFKTAANGLAFQAQAKANDTDIYVDTILLNLHYEPAA
jgi:hypothetical protein